VSGEFGFTYLKLGIIDFTELIFFFLHLKYLDQSEMLQAMCCAAVLIFGFDSAHEIFGQ